MEIVIMLLISAILSGCLAYVDTLLEGLVPMVLYSERYMDTLLGTNAIEPIFDIFFAFGISLIILKFLKNGFNKYILWHDGDSTDEPSTLFIGFLKALAIAICFPTMYGWLATIIEDMSNKLILLISDGMPISFETVIAGVASAGLFTGIVSLIFFICFFILYIQFLTRGLEIMILRIGLPLACVGLMDRTDSNLFKSYIQKFFQSTLAVLVQITLAKLGVGLMLNAHVFWGVASMMLAIRTPKFLQEFLIISGGQGGGISNKIYSTARIYQMGKTFFKK
ncbi:conjugal transfer protein TrbL family protein [Vallitalea guaymasensis]|uniref:Conjugal transfer protein TrbL n=1 Tax=Vallitalea guaymasensis TaxID=1185412 RepID=A0A8J8ME19_9FIRM|nr:conjugal transfer protein TrbL family protein [Vallitalea guaymasensis]QUH31108.1 hypothetical protein HYG85_20160 [Vallitalea guaymasensis]